VGSSTLRTFANKSLADVRRYWDERPCNVRHSSKPVGSKEYFDEVEARKYFVEPHIPGFAEFERWNGRTVLEIGCGLGTDTVSFARAGARVTAVELSEKSAELARRRLELFGLSGRAAVLVGDAESLPDFLPHQIFDLVYSFGVIHHSPHPRRIVEHVRRYMDARSELRLMVYARISYKLFWIMREEHIWDMSRIDGVIARNSEAQTGCPVTYTYTDRTLRELLAGYEVIDAHKAHIFTWDIDAYRHYEYRKAPEWAGVSDAELAELERELGWHYLVRARLALDSNW